MLLALTFILPAIVVVQVVREGMPEGFPIPALLLVPALLGIIYMVLVRR